MNRLSFDADVLVGSLLFFTGVFSLIYFKKHPGKIKPGFSQSKILVLCGIMAIGGLGILCMWLLGK
jgi:hypothetical protein